MLLITISHIPKTMNSMNLKLGFKIFHNTWMVFLERPLLLLELLITLLESFLISLRQLIPQTRSFCLKALKKGYVTVTALQTVQTITCLSFPTAEGKARSQLYFMFGVSHGLK